MGYDLPTGRKGKFQLLQHKKNAIQNGGRRQRHVLNQLAHVNVLMTIQLANMMATVVNEGYYYTPHIIKK